MTPTIVALIPARGGSTRLPRKNLAELGGRSLLVWTILQAQQADIFSQIAVSTEDDAIAEEARRCGAMVVERPTEYAADFAPDIGWLHHALETVRRTPSGGQRAVPDAFAILRPTSPFRSADTIRAAWAHLQHHGSWAVDSLRAVEPAKQHPLKMWVTAGALIQPFADWIQYQHEPHPLAPVHSQPTQLLFPVLAQNASLEMAWSRVVMLDADPRAPRGFGPTISGQRVLPWTMPGHEGFDINQPDDLVYAQWLLDSGRATLPAVSHG